MHRYSSFYANNQTTVNIFAQSGNKIPTIVQKFYTRLGNNLHEIANKFFWGQFRGWADPLDDPIWYQTCMYFGNPDLVEFVARQTDCPVPEDDASN